MQSMLSLVLFLHASTTAGYLAPYPQGKHNVSLTIGPLVDHTRNEPHSAPLKPRTLMLSVFQPASCESTIAVPYMPTKTAEFQGPFLQAIFNASFDLTPLLLEARLPVCPHQPPSCGEYPILLFSPGYSIPRLFYSVVASAIASEGFIVVTIDSPGDADIVTYPDGHAVYNNDTTQSLANIAEQIPFVVDDLSFVIDQLSNETAMARLLPHHGHRYFPTDRVAVMGHSLGGVSAVLAAGQDARIRGAINWDGTFITLPTNGTSQPVLLMSHGDADETWIAAFPLLKGPKLWVNIDNTTHETFADVPSLLQAAGQDAAPLADLLGTIAPAEMVRILVAYSTEWMHGVFRGREGGSLLEGNEPGRFPEVSVIEKANF